MKKNESYEEFVKGIWRDNPVFVQVLGMCPMLAVTNSAINAIAMGMASMFVLVGEAGAHFLLHHHHRDLRHHRRLHTAGTGARGTQGTRCLHPADRCELPDPAFASRYPTRLAVMDALGMAGGFMLALFSLGAVREILGDGALFGFRLFGENFEPWIVMILPPGGFLTLGVILLFFNWFKYKKDEFLADVAEAERSGS
jgi:electron transport complex protein RnfE